METISSNLVKARKNHTCDWCGGKIEVGTTYRKQFLKDDEPYTWKNHIYCEEIASCLDMFDDGGVTESDFVENIQQEWHRIMSKEHNELYESKDFKIPKFMEQLDFVIKHHNVSNKQ